MSPEFERSRHGPADAAPWSTRPPPGTGSNASRPGRPPSAVSRRRRRARAEDRRVALAVAAGCAGFVVGALVAFAATPERLGVPVLLAAAGAAIGTAGGWGLGTIMLLGAPRTRPSRPAEPATGNRLAHQPPPADRALNWHPDPLGGPGERLWDGTAWTEHVWRHAHDGPRRQRSRASAGSGR